MSTPSPFTVTKDGCHFEVKVDAHYVSDEEMQTLRRYIATITDENYQLRELVKDMCVWAYINDQCDLEDEFADRMRELGIEVDE